MNQYLKGVNVFNANNPLVVFCLSDFIDNKALTWEGKKTAANIFNILQLGKDN